MRCLVLSCCIWIDHFRYLKFILGSEAWRNKTKQMYYSLLSLKMISFVLFPQASEPTMDFHISKMVCSYWTAMQWLAYWITFKLNWTKLKHTPCSHIRNNIFQKKFLKSILSNTQYKLKKIIIFVTAKVSETDPK